MFAGINNSAVLAHGEKKRDAYSKLVSDLHHLNAHQSVQPRRAGLGQQASACRCCYACTRPMKSRAVDETSAAWSVILS